MKKYECEPCGYVYDEAAGDPDNGIAPGTKWEDLPADWVCPLCGAGKDVYTEVLANENKRRPANAGRLFCIWTQLQEGICRRSAGTLGSTVSSTPPST